MIQVVRILRVKGTSKSPLHVGHSIGTPYRALQKVQMNNRNHRNVLRVREVICVVIFFLNRVVGIFQQADKGCWGIV